MEVRFECSVENASVIIELIDNEFEKFVTEEFPEKYVASFKSFSETVSRNELG